MARNIYKDHGLKKLYLGFNSTFLRESLGLGVYFGVYDILMLKARAKKYNDKMSSLLSGGISGVVTWSVMYPVDYVKTLIQSDSLTSPKFKNATQCITS